MSEPLYNQTVVVLEAAQIVGNLYLEKIALLDRGVSLKENGELPEDRYCIYYRVALHTGNYGCQYLMDNTLFSQTNVHKLLNILPIDK